MVMATEIEGDVVLDEEWKEILSQLRGVAMLTKGEDWIVSHHKEPCEVVLNDLVKEDPQVRELVLDPCLLHLDRDTAEEEGSEWC
jgi:hypothetical protein